MVVKWAHILLAIHEAAPRLMVPLGAYVDPCAPFSRRDLLSAQAAGDANGRHCHLAMRMGPGNDCVFGVGNNINMMQVMLLWGPSTAQDCAYHLFRLTLICAGTLSVMSLELVNID